MIDLYIDNLSFGGRGVGRLDGKAVFVPYTVPGERVRCRIVGEKKSYCDAEVLEILDPASERIDPPCPVFGECGGCQWQHLSYACQLEWKAKLFREALSRGSQLDVNLFAPTVASPQIWNYRCRAKIKCRNTENGFVAGFYRPGSHYVVDIESCPLLADDLNTFLAAIKSLFAGFSFAHRVPQLDLTIDDNNLVSLIVHYLENDIEPLRPLLKPLSEQWQCPIYVQRGRKGSLACLFGSQDLEISPVSNRSMKLKFPPGAFVQVNLEQNRLLVADVVSQVSAGEKVLDLFCGIGNFSLPIASKTGSVTGVEDYAPAIDAAKKNARSLQFGHADFYTADVARWLSRKTSRAFDAVLLDPPRNGAREAVKALLELLPKKIIYVSCDPMTLSRDLKPLMSNGYRPKLFRAYDMFPQTYHIEGLAVLER